MDLRAHALEENKAAVDATKTVSDALVDHGKLALEHRKVGLGEQQQAHQQGVDKSKVAQEGTKIGISQQQADTQTHAALHPPKPAAPKRKKPK